MDSVESRVFGVAKKKALKHRGWQARSKALSRKAPRLPDVRLRVTQREQRTAPAQDSSTLQQMNGYRFLASKRYRSASFPVFNIVEYVPSTPDRPSKHVDALKQSIGGDDLNDHCKCLRGSKISLILKTRPSPVRQNLPRKLARVSAQCGVHCRNKILVAIRQQLLGDCQAAQALRAPPGAAAPPAKGRNLLSRRFFFTREKRRMREQEKRLRYSRLETQQPMSRLLLLRQSLEIAAP